MVRNPKLLESKIVNNGKEIVFQVLLDIGNSKGIECTDPRMNPASREGDGAEVLWKKRGIPKV